jgi:branched-chain amino acid transport system ATP-binding protein
MNDLPQTRSALELRGLRGGWGPTTVIEDLNLTLGSGETVSIVGRNGVGKSTLLELIVGRAQRAAGAIKFQNTDVTNLPVYRRSRLGLGYVPQEREVFASLTVAEHLMIAARPGEWNQEKVFSLFPSLSRRATSLGCQLSGGEQQMLAIARALVGNPTVLLMDEPSEGLAPVVVEQLVAAIRILAEDSSLSVLLVEQRLDIALQLSTRCLVMDRGRVVYEGPSAQLRNEPSHVAEIMGITD